MDSLDLIRTFREVASHGSFSRAARKLDVSKATVSKYIAELEARLGVIYMPEMLVQPHLDRGELVPVLQDFVRDDMWLSAAYLQRRHNSAALRALLDFHESRFSARSKARG